MENVNVIISHDSAGEEDGNGITNGRVELYSQTSTKQKEEDKMSREETSLNAPGIDLSRLPEGTSENDFAGGGDPDMEIEDLNEVPALANSCVGPENDGIHDLDRTDCLPSINDNGITAEALTTTVGGEVDSLDVHYETPVGMKKMRGNSVSGVKRPRLMFDEDHPSVCVKYNSLSRSSRLKLEELLQQWSQWHTQHDLSAQDSAELLESGEETFFPALNTGLEKASRVTFWMDRQTSKQQNDEFIPLDDKSVPLYDRGFALGLTSYVGASNAERALEIVDDAARCFNCGSYSHALKECPQPFNKAAVSNARKQRKLKRNQNSGSRNQARYYQSSTPGKYDGLRPGALDAETRKLLGLGELDPPPWLGRMRDLGYPPGYFDRDEEDEPSGITIFADGENKKDDQEDGEIVDKDKPEPDRKMSVEFPGINGPVPENADKKLWGLVTPPSLDIPRSRLIRRSSSNHSSELISRGHHREERWRSEYRDDGPPGVDPGFDPSMLTRLPRYDSNESGYDSHSPRFESLGRFDFDRGRRSRFHNEGPYSSSLPSNWHSPVDHSSLRYRNQFDEIRESHDFDYSAYDSRERHDRYRRISRR